MDQEIVDELNARADAGQKMGMVAIEMVVALAKTLGTKIDLRSFASDMENAEIVDKLSGGDFEIEAKSRRRVAKALRQMADNLDRQ